eukprot:gnl/TRDRNA2_/TRDRNA2_155174_c0_seq2.p1 gnl/TRDRNA2_/TRDRNA2_155174_c0~~gnl/TRDRNA2_/TRDRNA2_155174_c0_seq2.p1  ORF type:complete len:238 (+),score=38.89 gnl/TRDRNA2_/TRDRNA2_155174_c0_seq2:49-762(+)
MVTSLSSALSQMPDGFQLPELNWSMSGISSSSGSGSRDRSSGGFMPMPIVLSSAFARSGSSASRNDDEQPEGAEADWSIAGAPCGICEGLSWRERLFGFGICFAAGCFLTVAACGHWSAMFIGQGERFALTYTLGNILTIGSTFFLVGAQRQWSGMWAKNRRLASLGYVACTVFTLACVCVRWRDYNMSFTGAVLTFASVALQGASLLWYALSYIPFGRALFSRLLRGAHAWMFGAE